jgi:hypothetical protein
LPVTEPESPKFSFVNFRALRGECFSRRPNHGEPKNRIPRVF